MLYTPKRVVEYEDDDWGLCMWQLPDGTYVQDANGDYLCAGPAKIHNLKAESNMRRAVTTQLGITEGRPFWLPGFRKVTQSEWEDQMERLMDGKIPDAADLYRQSVEANGES